MVVKPMVVAGYTWFMGGVDLADQKRSYFECKIGTAKWPTHLFLWLIDAAMVNSQIWYVEEFPDEPKMTGREWRKRVVFGLLRLDRGRVNSTTLVLLTPREPPPPPSVADGATSARQLLPRLKTRWGDHVPMRRENKKRAIDCEWCKLQSKAAVASGRNALSIRETRTICSQCKRDAYRGCTDIALCTKLCQSSTEVGATCFYLYHAHILATPAASAAAEPTPTPDRLDDAMRDA